MNMRALQQQALAAALGRSDTLVSLLNRVRDSQARLQAVQALLPPGMAGAVQAGPLDEQQWMLLAKNAAVAAKLRQCVPQITAALDAAGFAPRSVKIKVSAPG